MEKGFVVFLVVSLSIEETMKTFLTITFCLILTSNVFAQSNIVYETIAREASGESFEAQVWVASVIITRARERNLSYERIVLQPLQFSCWNKGANQRARTTAELESARRAWEVSLTTTYDVNLYHDISVKPYWASRVTFVKKIGNLLFYKEKR